MAVFGAPVALARPRRQGRGSRPRACTPPRPGSTSCGCETGLALFELGIGVTTGPGGGGAARLRGAPRVHAGGRHRQSVAAPPAVGDAGRDGPQRGHLPGAGRPAACRGAPASAREGPGRTRRGVEGGGRDHRGPIRVRQQKTGRTNASYGGRGVRKTYEAEGAPVRALRGVDMTMETRRVRGHHGPVGLRQVHVAQPRRRSRRAHRGRDHRGGRVARRQGRERAGAHAPGATSGSSSSSSTSSRA